MKKNIPPILELIFCLQRHTEDQANVPNCRCLIYLADHRFYSIQRRLYDGELLASCIEEDLSLNLASFFAFTWDYFPEVLLKFQAINIFGSLIFTSYLLKEGKGNSLDGIQSKAMIPPKLLVYRRTHSDVNLETLQETWRRKKSCGDLFQNGYRVRQGHHGQEEKERQTGLYYSVWICLRVLSNWGKGITFTVYACTS